MIIDNCTSNHARHLPLTDHWFIESASVNVETGHFLRIQIPARTHTLWLGPAWAVVCGLIASGGFVWSGRDLLIAALAIVLADGAWATSWWGLVQTDWPYLIERWRAIRVETDLSRVPFAQAGSPSQRAQERWARLRVWWQSAVLPVAGTPVLSALFAAVLGFLLSAVIGWQALALSVAALALVQIGLVLTYRRAWPAVWAQGLLDVGLSWLLGHVAFGGSLSPLSLVAALLLSASYGGLLAAAGEGARAQARWLLLPQLILIVIFIVRQQPLAAFAVISLLVAQALLATVLRGLTYARAAHLWLMLVMLVTALAVR